MKTGTNAKPDEVILELNAWDFLDRSKFIYGFVCTLNSEVRFKQWSTNGSAKDVETFVDNWEEIAEAGGGCLIREGVDFTLVVVEVELDFGEVGAQEVVRVQKLWCMSSKFDVVMEAEAETVFENLLCTEQCWIDCQAEEQR